jgi:hypothetical protein
MTAVGRPQPLCQDGGATAVFSLDHGAGAVRGLTTKVGLRAFFASNLKMYSPGLSIWGPYSVSYLGIISRPKKSAKRLLPRPRALKPERGGELLRTVGALDYLDLCARGTSL